MDDFLSQMVPKDTTQVLDFLQNNPLFDGRGVRVAVMDTGVDPAAAGLQVTTEGKPKIIDFRDCTGDGDVKLVKEAKAEVLQGTKEGDKVYAYISGFHGQKLLITQKQFEMNKRNLWWLGEKDVYKFIPKQVVNRLKADYSKKSKAYNSVLIENAEQKKKELGEKQDKEMAELDQQLGLLRVAEKMDASTMMSTADPGVMANCVVFLDNDNVLRAMVDKTGTGDFTEAKVMASYNVDREFDKWERLTYCFNILRSPRFDADSEKTDLSQIKLSITCDGGNHGTHVASILTGNHPEKPDLNGIAPGAEVVALKIGDGRLHGGSMETSKSIIRAISYAVKSGCDIANMSFGEASYSCLDGAVMECISEAIHKHGIIFVTSAGNSGPGLSTVGAPGCSASSLFVTVGAYLTGAMRSAQYNLISDIEKSDFKGNRETLYDFSSRGPTYAGGIGVTVCAPGGAVASMSSWSMMKKKQMNGTSMASPNACGCLTLILSGLKANDVVYSPVRVKRALVNSAGPVPGDESHYLGKGAGLVKVVDCFELLMRELKATSPDEKLFFLDVPLSLAVSPGKSVVGGGTDLKEGIYIRTATSIQATSTHTVNIKPLWNDEEDYATNDIGYSYSYARSGKREGCTRGKHVITRFGKKYKAELAMNLLLRTSVPWVKVTEKVLFHGSEKFKVFVDPSLLSPGVHFTWVDIFETEYAGALGEELPLLRVPVTVVIPMNVNPTTKQPETDLKIESISFKPGAISRIFLAVPTGATWVDIKVTKSNEATLEDNAEEFKANEDSSKLFFITCHQMTPNGSYRHDQNEQYSWLNNQKGSEGIVSARVQAPGVIELCLCQSWRFRGLGQYSVEAKFQGLQLSAEHIFFSPETEYTAAVKVTSLIRNIAVMPTVNFTNYFQHIAPNAAGTISQDWDFDLLPYEYQNKYLGLEEGVISPSKSKTYGRATLDGFYNSLMKGGKVDKNTPGIAEVRKKMYQMILEYSLEMKAPSSVALSLGPVHDLLYDSHFSCHMMLVYNEHKSQVLVVDSFAKNTTLQQGKYIVRACLCHSEENFLNRFRHVKLKCNFSCNISAPVDVSNNRRTLAAMENNRGVRLSPGDSANLWLTIRKPVWPRNIKSGTTLTGKLKLEQHNAKSWGAKSCPGGFKVSIVASSDFQDFDLDSLPVSAPISFPLVEEGIKALESDGLKLSNKRYEETQTGLKQMLDAFSGKGVDDKIFALKSRLTRLELARSMLKYLGKDNSKLQQLSTQIVKDGKNNVSREDGLALGLAIFCLGFLSLRSGDLAGAKKKLESLVRLIPVAREISILVRLLGATIKESDKFFGGALVDIMAILTEGSEKLKMVGVSKLGLWQTQGRLLVSLKWYHLHHFQQNRMRLAYPSSYSCF